MEHGTSFFSSQGASGLLLILAVAGLALPFLKKMKIPPVLGYLLCGILIGPYGLGLWARDIPWLEAISISDAEIARQFGELGIVLLLFMIGLKLSLPQIRDMRHGILKLGGAQVLVTGAVISGIACLFENPVEVAIIVGASFALSSTAMVMQLLEEKHKAHQPIGRTCFAILLMQDLAVVPILVLLTSFAGGDGGIAWLLGKTAALSLATIFGVYFAGTRLLRPLLSWLSPDKNAEWLMSNVLLVVIGTALLTETAGLSTAMGAFLAGLLFAETEFKNEIESIIGPVKGLLLGIFFLSVGMMIDVREVLRDPLWLAAAVVGIGAVKAGILFAIMRFSGMPKKDSAETAVLMGQGGEFVFVIMTMAMAYRAVPAEDAQFFMLVTALSLAATPVVVAAFPHAARLVKRGRAVT